MEIFEINGGKRLQGEITLKGAKNSALPILSASLLVNGTSVIHNCPDLTDIRGTFDILRSLGCKVSYDGYTAVVDARTVNADRIDKSAMSSMRSSVLFLGSLLARLGRGELSFPGGCKIGKRPIDLHISALKQLGADIIESDDRLVCSAKRLDGDEIKLSFPSVGATENIMLAASLARGTTTIVNAAREPEITDLADFLNRAGARIRGAGEYVIRIDGVSSLHNCEHTIIPDRILASTYMSACAASRGDIVLRGIRFAHLAPIIPVYYNLGCRMTVGGDVLMVSCNKRPKSVGLIETKPYPGFPTDAQPMLCAVLCKSRGSSEISEKIFENRFTYIKELKKLGADITEKDNRINVRGVKRLQGAELCAGDLRAGAALVVAALSADGVTRISNTEYIDRGYERLEQSLSSLGADIKRIDYEKGKAKGVKTKSEYTRTA